jgi:predicted metal-dependent peptidase
VVFRDGSIHVHPTRLADPDEWAYVLAHCLLHLGFDHIPRGGVTPEWNAACNYALARFLRSVKIGRPPAGWNEPIALEVSDEARLAERFRTDGIPPSLRSYGTAGAGNLDMEPDDEHGHWRAAKTDWPHLFAVGLAAAVTSAVNVVAGVESSLGVPSAKATRAQRARSWFISSYPLLGALASSFTVIEDPVICARMEITVAAVSPASREIFMNPAAGLTETEARFVMGHELLHVGLHHDSRRQGRDPYLWNVACDYVINGWLLEMGVGDLPQVGGLYDPALKGESAESIYDRIVTDMRRYRRLSTLRGVGLTDVIEQHPPDWWRHPDGLALDDFYRRCLSQGLLSHQNQGRGTLPAALIEEIRALDQPPIPWDVELARWFDERFPPLEKVRSYARPSRRQSSTPDIPRPRYTVPSESWEARTFGVVLDTSGSMDRVLLARALGAIAGYSLARDVPLARVVFCDAAPYDQGYMAPDEIAGAVRVKGRGGTVLQPGVDLLEAAHDFPADGPILIITDGFSEPYIRVRREHAYLVPEGHRLPFPPRGDVFYIE